MFMLFVSSSIVACCTCFCFDCMAISIYNFKTHLTCFLPLSVAPWPIYSDKDFIAVESVIKSNQLFAASKVKSFESEFAAYIGLNMLLL